MGKDPAFLFYPNDWLGGTLGMTFEEKGAYMELLMLQFNRGHMTEHMIGQTIGQLWVNIKDKFIRDPEGLYYNSRLEIEVERRKNFVASRFNNIKGKNQHSKKQAHKGGHMTKHMENRNGNEIININPEFKECFNLWLEYKKERRETYKSPKSLQTCYDNLLKLSGNNPETALEIINQSIANNWAGMFPLKQKNNNERFEFTEADFR